MREKVRDKGRLQNILEAVEKAFEFTENVTFEEYKNNALLRFAVVKSVEIVGEASYNLTKEFCDQHSEIEWKQIIAMRHILVHGYYQIEDIFVWDTVKIYFPPLKEKIQIIYDNL